MAGTKESSANPPTVTVVIAARDAGRFLGPAIESILGQSFRDLELLVVDDGSTDGSTEIARDHPDPRLRFFACEHAGISAARNHALEYARGRYVACMDADDVAHPDRLARQVDRLESEPALGVLGASLKIVDADGCPTGRFSLPPETNIKIQWMSLFHCPIAHSTSVIRRSVLDRLGLSYDETLRVAVDYDLWSRLLPHTRAANLPEPLVSYRRHDAQTSVNLVSERVRNHEAIVQRSFEALWPGHGLSEQEIVWMRRLLFNGESPRRHPVTWTVCRLRGARLALAYLELFDRFSARHAGDPDLPWLRRRYLHGLGCRILSWPRPVDWRPLYLRLARSAPGLTSRLIRHARAGGQEEEPSSPKPVRVPPPRVRFDLYTGQQSTIFLCGAARSGTTWLAETLNHDHRYRMLFEPFLPEVTRAVPCRYPYVAPDETDPELVRGARAVLTGRARARMMDRTNPRAWARRRIVKEVRAHMMLAFLHRLAPRMPVVLVIRNPLAVAASRLRMGMQNHYEDLMALPRLLEDHPRVRELGREVEGEDDAVLMVFLWCVLHHVLFAQRPASMRITGLAYERALMRPEPELGRLFASVGRRLDPSALEHLHRPSWSSGRTLNLQRPAQRLRPLREYRELLGPEEIRRGRDLVAAFGFDEWYDDDGLPSAGFPFPAAPVVLCGSR